MSDAGRLRIMLFSSMVLSVLLGGIYYAGSQARPLFDANISLTKTGDPTEFTEAGQEIVYTFVVKNTSGNELLSVWISDSLVDVTCPSDTLAAGSEMTCSGVYQITTRDMETGIVENQATASGYYEEETNDGECCSCGTQTDYIDVSASDSFTLIRGDVPAAFIILTITAEPNTFKWPGETITYTYTVENTGNTYIEGPVRVTDDLLNVYCPLGGLEPGQRMVCTADYTTTEADMAAFSITNTATADAGDGVTSTDTLDVYLESILELTFTKTSQVETYSEYWQLIIYDFVVTNSGNVPFDGPVMISDNKMDEWSCPEVVTFYPGDTLTCAGYYRVRDEDIGKSINNCASAYAHLLNGTFSSNESCETIYWVDPVPEHPCETWPDC